MDKWGRRSRDNQAYIKRPRRFNSREIVDARPRVPLTREEYDLLIEAGYNLEPYDELCIIKSNDMFYREEYEEMLRTAKQISAERSGLHE